MEHHQVAGSCERCGRPIALLIPAPGPGDLQFERFHERLGSCASCGRLLGRDCCWRADGSCDDCVARGAEAEAPDSFAAVGVARAAVRHLDGLAPAFHSAEELIRAVHSDSRGGSAAWDEAWLASARLAARVEAMRRSAESWLDRAPETDQGRAAELRWDLAVVADQVGSRWSVVVAALQTEGRRIAQTVHEPATATVPASVPVRPDRAQPASAPQPDATAVRIEAGERAAFDIPDTSPTAPRIKVPPAPRPAAVAPTAPQTQPDAAAGEAAVAAAPPVAPPPPIPSAVREHEATTIRAPVRRPSEPTPIRLVPARPRKPLRVPPDAQANNEAPAAASRRVRVAGGVLAAVLVVGAAGLIAWSVLVGPMLEDGSRQATVPSPDPPFAASSASAASSTSVVASEGTGEPESAGSVLSVDLLPVGPLEGADPRVTRVTGAPRVVPVPSAFDRSVRLTHGSGLCVAAPAGGRAALDAGSVAFDVSAPEAAEGAMLVVRLPAQPQGDRIDVTIDLGLLPEPKAWYRSTVTVGAADARVTLRGIGDGSGVVDIPALTSTSDASPSERHACFGASFSSPDASVLFDNVQLDP